jgi:hypothetical protein
MHLGEQWTIILFICIILSSQRALNAGLAKWWGVACEEHPECGLDFEKYRHRERSTGGIGGRSVAEHDETPAQHANNEKKKPHPTPVFSCAAIPSRLAGRTKQTRTATKLFHRLPQKFHWTIRFMFVVYHHDSKKSPPAAFQRVESCPRAI